MSEQPQSYDVIVLGAGAAGLMCALTAGQRGRHVLVLELSNKVGKKILMSGGGRCNFTNLDVTPDNFICVNPHFVKSALSQYSQWDFISLVAKHGIPYHEKTLGQLFCDKSAKDIVGLLLDECVAANVEIKLNCETLNVNSDPEGSLSAEGSSSAKGSYKLDTSAGRFLCESLVVATGGLSVPSLGGASGFGYKLAQQFGLPISNTEASLVPFTLTGDWHEFAKALSGVSLPVKAAVPSMNFNENMLFTHRGISGPAILQLSNYWHLGEMISIDLLPGKSVYDLVLEQKQLDVKTTITTLLNGLLPKSLVKELQTVFWARYATISIQEIKNRDLQQICEHLHNWQITPSGTEGYRTAEVTRGGVSVEHISSKTMQVRDQAGLFIIGEVVDVVGHLGGFNFQWAWSSGFVAGSNA